MKIPKHISIEGVNTLGSIYAKFREHNTAGKNIVFITISPNPKTTHTVCRLKRKAKMAYGMLTHEEQYKYMESYIKDVYLRLMEPSDMISWVYELNKDNNLHVHALLYSDTIQDEYSIQCLRKTVYSNIETIRNKAKGAKYVDWMNSIVYVYPDKLEETINYLNKQNSIKDYYSGNYSGSYSGTI